MAFRARVGALLLVAATVVGGGLTVGSGIASADCQGNDPDYLCINERTGASGSVENIDVGQNWAKSMTPGSTTEFRIQLSLNENAERAITKITHRPPAGFVLRSAGLATGPRTWPKKTGLDFTYEANPLTGVVTVTAPPEGWLLQRNDTYSGVISLYLSYDVLRLSPGTTGVTVAATDLPETAEVATGTIDPFSSLGGYDFNSSDVDFGSLATGSETGSN
ncbi:hypothetical protein ACWDUM_10465 [Rhodococcus sp. NPDC003322]